ncbi:hypothetical protein BJX61DRAFT_539204 [Aspergillus egyptiacus]|nr:hypothetical protein BJX61DRAFT_539204 [Aspergillus egyptiacus]
MEICPVRQGPLSPSLSLPSQCQSSPALPIEPLAGYPGLLSRYNYRKIISLADAIDSQEAKTLRRKNAASNLNKTAAGAPMGALHQNAYYQPVIACSTRSSPPPPLSPSYSPSAVSDQLPDLLDGYGYPLSPLESNHNDFTGDKQVSYKLLDTFRDRLEKFPDPDDAPELVGLPGHSRARSDSALFKTRRTTRPPATPTVVHQGTSFDILNPHDSLNFARIVSYIEDVDNRSSSNHQRDSYLSTDGANVTENLTWGTTSCDVVEDDEQKAHDDLVGDSPRHHIPSISERLDERDLESRSSPSVRPLCRQSITMIQAWNDESDIGEPGPTHYEDDPSPPLPSTHLDPIHLAALYDIGHLPEQGKGAANPTTIIYSEHKPLHKKPNIVRGKRKQLSSSSSFGFSPSAAAATASAPLRRLRGMAQSLRRKTFPRTGLS